MTPYRPIRHPDFRCLERDIRKRCKGTDHRTERTERAGYRRVRHLFLAIVSKRSVVGFMLILTPKRTLMVVHDLAGSGNVIAVSAKIFHEGPGVFKHGIFIPFIKKEIA